jgi:hypothetical protein
MIKYWQFPMRRMSVSSLESMERYTREVMGIGKLQLSGQSHERVSEAPFELLIVFAFSVMFCH